MRVAQPFFWDNAVYQNRFQNPFAPTPMVRGLLIATGAAFFAQLLFRQMNIPVSGLFGLSRPGLEHLMLWQPITYMFVHGGVLHILMNMLGLFFFGPETERVLGSRKFLALYLACGVLGGLGWLLLAGGKEVCIGASGAVFGVLGAFVGLHPKRPITLLVFFVLPVTLPARTMAIGLGLINLFMMLSGEGGVAYAAHLAGGLAGYLYIMLWVGRGFSMRSFSPKTLFNNLLWKWHRRKFKVMNLKNPAEFRSESAPDEPELNRILEKISRRGMASLTPDELAALRNAGRGGHGWPR